MKLTSNSLTAGQPVPTANAFGVIDVANHVALASNCNPHLAWTDAPAATRSFAIVCHDPDVPSRGDDVNQDDREVPADLPRVNFFHWLLWNIPAGVAELAQASQCDGVTPHGKSGPEAPAGFQHGRNSFTGWFAGDAAMAGDYFGYDGPCPPWNDALVHRYIFSVYALDVEQLAVGGSLSGDDLWAAIDGHVLAQARIETTYTLNPRLAK